MVKSGQSLAVVSKVLGVSDQTLHNWVKLDKNGQLNGPGSKPVSPEQMEIARLRAELARVALSSKSNASRYEESWRRMQVFEVTACDLKSPVR